MLYADSLRASSPIWASEVSLENALRASSPIWASEVSLARRASRERANEGPRKGELATISRKSSFPPRNPGTPQRVKIVTANVRQIRKVTTACQVSLDS